jgi:hypothetical protein
MGLLTIKYRQYDCTLNTKRRHLSRIYNLIIILYTNELIKQRFSPCTRLSLPSSYLGSAFCFALANNLL